ncbi:hypothetical protein PV325_009048 [Microctonus aethiopoides]|uniref:FP protein C-terminal domain-containing protein n=1 Tax=Microctonus aethiopoides TaxID=144406 RepID=A0AA39KLB8_9HYME|nr:hypothetical protein PV325_009048 [Microctonus aethiopoides]KAK0165566.1 hypothetical protein PV328_004071 [Microctonus aethiopoides]
MILHFQLIVYIVNSTTTATTVSLEPRSTSPSLLSTSTTMSSSSQKSSIETTLNTFIAQQNQFNTRLTQLLEDQSQSLKQQSNKLNEQNTKINEIHNITKTVAEHQIKIKNLKSSSEIIISGLPSQLITHNNVVVEKVLTVIGAPQLSTDILSIRHVKNNNTRNSNQAIRTVNDSLIIKFKSEHIVKYVIDCKRQLGKLTLERLFGTDTNGIVYINEFLNSTKYELYLKTKNKIRSQKWKYVWISDGNIYVRQDDGKDKIKILTSSDLDQITSSI